MEKEAVHVTERTQDTEGSSIPRLGGEAVCMWAEEEKLSDMTSH